ncbi:hypothetical protein N7541_006223 [Penicillium brevicompactum]|uniref:Probable E3 ubiquitin ligase complex SCF subunit sconB n=1 Tax=Penicillium brevicompactum TaxID=5074 RepID=A0A9W9R7K8_PENBR|nr:hypothetical protein N7541_006223 [Penicillium brevicompactum]
MSKRRRDCDLDSPKKRIRAHEVGPVDRLSSLSNELLLHILSFLPVSSLNICQRLSRRFHTLGGDSELWKRQYYSQWVRPRARRLAKTKRTVLPSKVDYSPRVATWFDHGHLAHEGNWKRQYRLRHNWSRGLCRVTEVEFPEPSSPPTLVRFCAGIVFMADSTSGLRAWTAKDHARCVASVPLSGPSNLPESPTALAVSQVHGQVAISVGLENGHLRLFLLDLQTFEVKLQSSYAACNGAITAMALSTPYLLVVSQYKHLTLYRLPCHNQGGSPDTTEPRRLASLKADNIVAPMTLSLRVSPSDIIATIVYSFFHLGCGWSLGIQEIRLDKDGQQLDSRLTTTVDSQYGVRPLRGLQSGKQQPSAAEPDNYESAPDAPFILHRKPPTSMSYSHPYLLTSHADNTLTMYLVVSASNKLFVQGGRRLWGHTSSVSAVQVTKRGKAVSVSSRGDEIRIWELETAISSLGTRKILKEDHGIQLSTGNTRELESALPMTLSESLNSTGLGVDSPEWSRMQDCVGFDEERVLLLREKGVGTQLLECYDFT